MNNSKAVQDAIKNRDQQALAAALLNKKQPKKANKDLWGGVTTFAHGGAAHFGDEIAGLSTEIGTRLSNALMLSDADPAEEARKAREGWQSTVDDFAARRPVSSMALDIGGAVTSGAALSSVLAGGVVPKALAGSREHQMALAKILGGVGALEGGAYTTGDLSTGRVRPIDVGTGMLIGGLTGPLGVGAYAAARRTGARQTLAPPVHYRGGDVTKDGNIRAYHGTRHQFDAFSDAELLEVEGHYFSSSRQDASTYVRDANGRILEVDIPGPDKLADHSASRDAQPDAVKRLWEKYGVTEEAVVANRQRKFEKDQARRSRPYLTESLNQPPTGRATGLDYERYFHDVLGVGPSEYHALLRENGIKGYVSDMRPMGQDDLVKNYVIFRGEDVKIVPPNPLAQHIDKIMQQPQIRYSYPEMDAPWEKGSAIERRARRAQEAAAQKEFMPRVYRQPPLNEQHAGALIKWRDNFGEFRDLNRYLRSGTAKNDKVIADYDARARVLQDAILQGSIRVPEGKTLTVYRNQSLRTQMMEAFGRVDPEDLKKLKGVVMKDDGFFATSLRDLEHFQFLTGSNKPFGVKLELTVPNGSKGAWVSQGKIESGMYLPDYDNVHEAEILFPKGTEYRIMDIIKGEKGGYTIKAEVLPYEQR